MVKNDGKPKDLVSTSLSLCTEKEWGITTTPLHSIPWKWFLSSSWHKLHWTVRKNMASHHVDLARKNICKCPSDSNNYANLNKALIYTKISHKRNCTNELKIYNPKTFYLCNIYNYLIMTLKGIHIIDYLIQDDALASTLDT
jgi:hypothetical protein